MSSSNPRAIRSRPGFGRILRDLIRYGRGACTEPEPIGASGLLRLTNLFVDIYGAWMDRSVILIDSGMDPRGRPLDAMLAALGASRSDVSDLFLTHGHPDHVAGAGLFASARIHAGIGDAPRIRGQQHPAKLAERVFRSLFPCGSFEADHWLQGRCEIPVGAAGESVLALPIPGDTPGAYAYLLRGVLIVGDALDFRQGALHPAASYATDDPELNLRSIAALPAEIRDRPFEYLCTSHGEPTPAGSAKGLLDAVAVRAARESGAIAR